MEKFSSGKVAAVLLIILLILQTVLSSAAVSAAGNDRVSSVTFEDVPDGSYYENSVYWAVKNGITEGTGPASFSPSQICTRREAVTFLWRYAGSPSAAAVDFFNDVPADTFYSSAVSWAVTKKITAGTSSDHFSPENICTRAQIAAFLYKAYGNGINAKNAGFSDVSASDRKAVNWAYAMGITAGTSVTQFSPEKACTRAEIVTFLYRYANNKEREIPEVSGTPVEQNGRLSVGDAGYKAPTLISEKGSAVRLCGVSTHGVQWFPQYISEESFRTLRDDWGVNVVRLAVYPKEGGYLDGRQNLMDSKIEEGVAAAEKLGIYVIIDWHVLNYNPNETRTQAENFFRKYAEKYKHVDNVIFEICNEPVGTPWYDGSGNDLYTYCSDIIGVIRSAGSDAVVLCGTNTWSQDIDEVAEKPLKTAGYDNVMYTLHFYAATHYDNIRNKLSRAVSERIPVFVSEFGVCDASGSGNNDLSNADVWMKMLDKYNISFCCWSLCNKNEAASLIRADCSKLSGWDKSELTEGGIWFRNICRSLSGTTGNNTDSGTGMSGKSRQNQMPAYSK